MVRRRALLAALLLLPVASAAPALGLPLPAGPEDALEEAQRRGHDAYAATTGERLDREEVDVTMDMEFRDVRLDAFGLVFGGGTFVAQSRLTTRLAFHVISVGRVQESLEEASGQPLDPSSLGLDARRQHLTADAFRATLAGEALAAFQAEQEVRVAQLVAESFPDVTVRGSYFAWSNTSASDNGRGDDPPGAARPTPGMDARNPPVTLVSVLDLEYRRRESLLGLVEDAFASAPPAEESEERLRERLEDEAHGAPHERSVFALLGVPQLIRVNAPSGWDVTLRIRLPEGLTFEEASPDVALEDGLRAARTSAYARDSETEVQSAVAVTLGSRAHVAFALLGLVLLGGVVVRVPACLVGNWLARRR